ncbi:hypothetical protein FWF74_00335 [Candidatus Saccharibacteria bacterium]|nr:hypothetical protein [Candidatus Saccharibacteria bacterium]MCL1963158.1 hypothetical protein [Candidatus Saccharibacteria bacterium]
MGSHLLEQKAPQQGGAISPFLVGIPGMRGFENPFDRRASLAKTPEEVFGSILQFEAQRNAPSADNLSQMAFAIDAIKRLDKVSKVPETDRIAELEKKVLRARDDLRYAKNRLADAEWDLRRGREPDYSVRTLEYRVDERQRIYNELYYELLRVKQIANQV